MGVTCQVIRPVIRSVLSSVIRQCPGGGEVPVGPPTWQTIPNVVVYENELPYTTNYAKFVSANPAVTSYSAVLGTFSNQPSGDYSFTGIVGEYTETLTATNASGPGSSKQFTITVLAGSVPTPPTWDAIPNVYSVEGIPGGNTTPPPLNPAVRALAEDDTGGVPMADYVNNKDDFEIVAGSWELLQGNSVATIDTATGTLRSLPTVPTGMHTIQVSCANTTGFSSASPEFTWSILSNQGFIVDFSERQALDWSGMLFSRDSTQTFSNYLAETDTAPSEVPAMVGRERTGSTYVERDVTYGVKIGSGTVPWVKLGGIIGELTQLPSGGMEIEACFQIVFRVDALPLSGPNGVGRIFSLASENDANGIAEIVLYEVNGTVNPGQLALGVRTNKDDPIGNNGFASAVGTIPNIAVGDVLDVRGRVQRPGREGQAEYPIEWIAYRNNSVTGVADGRTSLFPTMPQGAAMDILDIGGLSRSDTDFNSNITAIYCRMVPTGYLADSTIWPGSDGVDPQFLFWYQPEPVIIEQPQSIHFGATETVEPVTLTDLVPVSAVGGTPIPLSAVATGDLVITYDWEFDANDGGGYESIATHAAIQPATNTATANPTITLPIDPGTYSYRVTVDNAAMQPQQSTAAITVSAPSVIPTGEIIALFTDLNNGINNGWHDDATKGAAVTIFGAGFGQHPDTSPGSALQIGTAGNMVAVPSSHIVEWDIPSAPAYIPGLRMITFHVPDNATYGVALGDQEIVITRDESGDAEATATQPLPFHVRDTGRILYFNAETGSSPQNGGTGEYGAPFDHPGNVFNAATNPGLYGLPGDHYYMMQTATPYAPAGGGHGDGGSGGSVIFLEGLRAQAGTAQKGVSISGYPSHNAVLLESTDDKKRCMFGFKDRDHYTISKLSCKAQYATCTPSGANDARIVCIKGDGLHLDSRGESGSTGDFGFAKASDDPDKYKNNNIKFWACETSGGDSNGKSDHAFYPGAGAFEYPGFEIAYCYVHGNEYDGGDLLSINWDSLANGPRVADGKRVQAMAIHHNVIDCRGPTTNFLHTGIGINGLQDTRTPDRLPQSGEKFSGRIDMHHNLIIGASDGIRGGTNFAGINTKCRAINNAMTNNTFYHWPDGRAIVFTNPSGTEDDPYDPEKGTGVDPSFSPYYEAKGNLFVQEDASVGYVNNSALPDERYTFVAANNIYAGGRNTASSSNYLLNETSPILTTAGNAGLTVDPTPGAVTITLASDSIAKDTGANYGLANADLNNRPYRQGGNFQSGATQAEES